MALKRATKSIPLSGGANNEAPDELLSPPALIHVENARFTKVDFAEKTEPMTDQGASGIGFYTNQKPFALEEVNNTLVGIGQDDYFRYDGTSFETTVHQTDIMGMDRILSTAEQAGGNHYTWARSGTWSGLANVTESYAVAFEKRDNTGTVASVASVITNVYVHRYDLEGNLIDETIIEGAMGPRLVTADSLVGATLFYQIDDDLYYRHVNYSTNSTAMGSATLIAANVSSERQEYKNTSKWGARATSEVERYRASYAFNCKVVPTFVVEYDPITNVGAVAWKDWSSGQVKYQMLAAAAIPDGSTKTTTITNDSTTITSILDVATDATHVYFLHCVTNTATVGGDTDILVFSVTHANASALTSTLETAYGGSVCVGSLTINSSVQHACYHTVQGDPEYRMGQAPFAGKPAATYAPDLAPIQGCVFKSATSRGGAYAGDFILSDHRLSSNLVVDNDGDTCCVVEQYANFSPNYMGVAASGPTTTPTAIKPVTSVMVKVDRSANKIFVLATYDAGQSKGLDHSISEQSNHLPTLEHLTLASVNGVTQINTFTYGNRNILTSEDNYFYLSDQGAQATATAYGNMSLLAGSSRMNLYTVDPAIRLHSVKYGEGFLINASVPLWFDGGGLGEASIIDQPEITGYEVGQSHGQIPTWCAYQAWEADDYQTVTCVCGYTDTSGKIHRSAPSFPLFIGKISKVTNPVESMQFSATVPLAISGSRREYFMEFYLADIGDSVGDLASRVFFYPNESAQRILTNFMVVMGPTTDGTQELATIHQSPALYTAGDVLPSDPWPSFDHMVVSSRRMFALAESAPSTIYYSKIFEENIAPEFSAALVLSIGGATKLTALGRVDDKIIAFEKDAVHVISGTGPDNTGANGDFLVERMSTNIGCEDIESIVFTNDGLAYYSAITQEFHLISRDLQIVDIGKPLQDITANTDFDVHSALVYPAEHEIRWYCSSAGTTDLVASATLATGTKEQPPRARVGRDVGVTNPVLVYNTQYAKWSVNDGPDIGYATTLWDNKPALLDDGANVWTTSTDWTDGNLMVWETPWIKVNMLQDFGRIYKATFLGRYLSSWDDTSGSVEAGDLNITCSYDYEENGDTDTHRFRANEHFGASQGDRLQFSVRPDRPKCQAIKFRIEETATTAIEVSEPTYATGRGMSLLSVDIHYGIKGGSSKISAKRKL